jgi:hypothetical protein
MKFQLTALFLLLAIGVSLAKPSGHVFSKVSGLFEIFSLQKQ